MQKRILKQLAALILLIGCLLSLCSCLALDQMRENQAFRQEDGSLLFQGKRYFETEQYDLTFYDYKTGYATSTDTPVLLSKIFGTQMLYNEGKTILQLNYPKQSLYYFREDVFNEYSELLENHSAPYYCCNNRLLTSAQIKAIQQALEQDSSIRKGAPSNDSEMISHSVIYRCNKTMDLMQYAFSLYKKEDQFYLTSYDYEENQWNWYILSKECNEWLENL